MASRKKPNSRGEILQQEDVLQAIVIADSFNVRFSPITKQKPRALLPLANVPLLDYTLQFLVEAGVQEIYVYCCAHADQIKAHIRNSKWNNPSAPYSIHTIVSEDCMSVGDALRDIDGKSFIKSDFVLVHGDLVSNVKLSDIITRHKERRKVDKNCVMTMVMQKCSPGGASRCLEEDCVVAMDGSNQRVMHYQKAGSCRTVRFPVEILRECSRVRLRYDLLDCQISICSPLVAPLFSDNFDYLTRDAFIHGILVNEEILGNTIYADIIEDQYAVRVSNMVMYNALSQDVLNRWTYPIVPDNSPTSTSQDNYVYGRHNIYLASPVTLARDCSLKANVLVGPGTEIGSCTVVCNSVIGANCRIGCNVRLETVYVWDNVTIEDNCTVRSAVLCDGVQLKQNSIVHAGSILSYDVVAGPDVTIPSQTLLVSKPSNTDIDKGSVYGDSEKAFVWLPASGDDGDADEEMDELIQDVWGLSLVEGEEESDGDDDVTDDDDDVTPGGSPQPDDDATVFYSEVMNTLERAEEENLDADNIVLEINSLKHAYNITIKEVNQFVIQAIVDYPLRENPDMETNLYFTELQPLLKRCLNVLKNYIRRKEAHLDCLATLEEQCLKKDCIKFVLMRVVHLLYDEDVLAEEAIVDWFNQTPATDQSQARVQIRKQLAPFIKWLREADEESDDDSS